MRLFVTSTLRSLRTPLSTFSMATKYSNDMINSVLKPEVVLSKDNQKACIEKFKSYQVPTVCGKGVPEAAVLVPLCLHKGELCILYTLRSMKLTVNRGQVSFPGGKKDKNDVDLVETALRETWEELKIPKEQVNVWAAGNLIGKRDVNVMPVLGYIGEVVPEELEINHDEVEEAFVVSLQRLCDPQYFRYTNFFDRLILPTYLGGKYRIWGFTAWITHMILYSLVPEVYRNEFPQQTKVRNSGNKNRTSTNHNFTLSKI